MQFPRAVLLVLFLVGAPACGGSDDDCYWERRCESIGGQLTCVWVKICPGDPEFGARDRITYPLQASPEAASWDVRLGTAGATADGTNPLLARLLGHEIARTAASHGHLRWWLHGWPAAEIDEALRAVASPAVEMIRPRDPAQGLGARCLGRVHVGALPPLPDVLQGGEPLRLTSPPASALVPASVHLGLVAHMTPLGGGAPRTRFLVAGESTEVDLEEPGPWRVRLVLVSENLCEPGVGDLVLVQETDVEVAAAR